MGADDIGMMIVKNTRNRPAPSIIAASSISFGIPRKNCLRKKTENGVISSVGSTVKMGGTIRAVMKAKKSLSRPGQESRANAYAASAQKKTWPTVVVVATIR